MKGKTNEELLVIAGHALEEYVNRGNRSAVPTRDWIDGELGYLRNLKERARRLGAEFDSDEYDYARGT